MISCSSILFLCVLLVKLLSASTISLSPKFYIFFHFQESTSTYKLVEVSTGAKLSRHNLHIKQHGPETSTELSSFHLSSAGQIQDMYSRVVLDHPRGFSRQLHKCIAARASSQIVFNGNIKVNR